MLNMWTVSFVSPSLQDTSLRIFSICTWEFHLPMTSSLSLSSSFPPGGITFPLIWLPFSLSFPHFYLGSFKLTLKNILIKSLSFYCSLNFFKKTSLNNNYVILSHSQNLNNSFWVSSPLPIACAEEGLLPLAIVSRPQKYQIIDNLQL